MDSTITIAGNGFGNSDCQVAISFGVHDCDVISWSNTEITCQVRNHTLDLLANVFWCPEGVPYNHH